MDALLLHLKKLHQLGFVGTSSVDYKAHGISLSGEDPFEEISREIHPSKMFYKVTVRYGEGTNDDSTFEQAYALDNGYIGNVETAERLVNEFGILPEQGYKHSNVCCVGHSDRDNKWYGWSHRAISGFASRDEAVAFAESVSSSTFEEAASGFIDYASKEPELFHGLSATRKQNPKTYRWYRYDGTKRMRLKEKGGKQVVLERGDVLGLKYNTRSKEVYLTLREDLSTAWEMDVKKGDQIFKVCKPFRGKVGGEAVSTDKKDYLTDTLRSKLSAGSSRTKPAGSKPAKPSQKPSAKPAGRKPRTATRSPVTHAKPRKFNQYYWLKVKETAGLPKLKTMEGGEPVVLKFDKDDIIGVQYEADANAFVIVVDGEPDLLFECSHVQFKKILKGSTFWRGKVTGLTGKRYNAADTRAFYAHIESKEFASEVRAIHREEKRAAQVAEDKAFVESPDAIDEGGAAITKRDQKAIDKAIQSGENVWYAAGVTNVNRNKANVVFADSKNAAVKRLKPLMKNNSGEEIFFGMVNTANATYRQYVEAGEKRAGVTIASGRINGMIRDAVKGTSGSTKSGSKLIPDQEVQIPEFNENYVPAEELAPVFRGNNREVLTEVSRAITEQRAYSGAFVPEPKLRQLKIGLSLILIAKHNNDRFVVEGKRMLQRIRNMYGTNAFVGRFRVMENGTLILGISIGKATVKDAKGNNVSVTDEAEERARRIRLFMTGTDESRFDVQEQLRTSITQAQGEKQVAERKLSNVEGKLEELDEVIKAKQAAIDRAVAGTTGYLEEQLERLETAKRPVDKHLRQLKRKIRDANAIITESQKALRNKDSAMDGVYATDKGDQVRILGVDYKQARILVTPLQGSRARFMDKYYVTKLYDLGGNVVVE